MRLLSLALVVFTACSSAPKRIEDPSELGRKLASDPRDWEARQDLANLRYADGLWAQALREYVILERQENLGTLERVQLGKLLVDRAKGRLEVADPAALDDLKHAMALGVASEALLPRALELAAVASLRHSSAFTRAEASHHLRRLAALSPGNVRTQHESLIGLDTASVLQIFEWFLAGGAKRQALRVVEHYIQSGGRNPQVVNQWLELHQWWYGERRSAIPSEAAALGSPKIKPLARLAAALHSEVVPARERVAQGLTDDWQLELWKTELVEVEEAYRLDPARADRLARHFVDSDVYGSRRLAALTELFHRLGDTARAKRLGIELASLSRGMPAFSLVAGLACAYDADLGPANQFFITAAAASGDPGRYWAIAARALRRAGHHLPAVAANRRALALTSPGQDLRILLELSLAQAALGRNADAQQSLDELLSRVSQAQHPQARLLVAQWKQGSSDAGPDLLSVVRVELGL